jgi:hypothetical protein
VGGRRCRPVTTVPGSSSDWPHAGVSAGLDNVDSVAAGKAALRSPVRAATNSGDATVVKIGARQRRK